ncbi:MAG: sigma-70 family RNA polymerase sigma factor [Muribaculaceae bacterium]|nr:sigma-70 family RNA polymerase sigma factor [Muribaculaceae bacterium]
MESAKNPKQLNETDAIFIKALKMGNNEISRQFFYKEIGGILHKIRMEVFRGNVDFDELVSELYIYLSRDNWTKFDGFDGKNGCRLRTWIIPVAWRYFMSIRERLLKTEKIDDNSGVIKDSIRDDLRIQIAIDVNAVLSRMPNQRYAEIIRLLLIEGYASQDVADMLDMKVENIYNLKHRAINQFIELYGRR